MSCIALGKAWGTKKVLACVKQDTTFWNSYYTYRTKIIVSNSLEYYNEACINKMNQNSKETK